MYARVEGCVELVNCTATDEDIMEFESPIDLDTYTGEQLEITLKKDSVVVEASGIHIEFPNDRVSIFEE